MPYSAINNRICLDERSLLVRMIGVMKREEDVADFIKSKWRPRKNSRLTRVNRQTYKLGFYCSKDYDIRHIENYQMGAH